MKNSILKIGIAVCISAAFSIFASAQTPEQNPPIGKTHQEIVENLCTAQEISEPRAYSFRSLDTPTGDAGWFGKKPWYAGLAKVLPFVEYSPKDKYAVDDIRTLQNSYGKPAPVGESKRSRQLRTAFEAKIKTAQIGGETDWWNLPRFDWRERNLDVGEVGFQGWECSTCWAFAAMDAAQISRRLAAMRSGRTLDETLRPSARQMISCMTPNAANFCKENWHGDAFTFLMSRGLPLGGARKYGKEKIGWKCDAEKFVKALTWDYVSAKPPEIPTAAEIKRAVVTYGAVVSVIRLDNCFALYGGGIFNEQRKNGGNHFVLIIGWDDAKKAWLVKNSFGTDWGESGFAWIKYESNTIGRFSAVVVADPQEEERIAGETKN